MKQLQVVALGWMVCVSAFSYQVSCERDEYDRSKTRVEVATTKTTSNFSIERNARSDSGFFQKAFAFLGLPLEKNDDVLRMTISSEGLLAAEVLPNVLLGYLTIWDGNSKFRTTLTRTGVKGTESFPLEAKYLHVNTEQVTREAHYGKFTTLEVSMNVAAMPWTNFIDRIVFDVASCKAGG